MFIQVLGRLKTVGAQEALAECSLYDDVDEVRATCMDWLKKTKDSRVVQYYIHKLGDKDNLTINRAARGLMEMGDPAAIGPLIEALITDHKITIPGGPPGKMTGSFSPKGSGSGGIGLGVGGGGPKTKVNRVRNQTVLDALVALTGRNFEFNVEAWRQWHLAQQKDASEAAGKGKRNGG